MKKLIYIILLLLLLPVKIFAALAVSNVTGTIADGETITITGTDFGSGPTVVLFDDFEGGTLGENILTGAGSAKYGQWTSRWSTGQTTTTEYTNTTTISGDLAYSSDISLYTWSTNDYRVKVVLNSTDDVFISRWQYLALSTNWPGEGHQDGINYKTVWLYGNDTATTGNDIVFPTISGPTTLTDTNSTSQLQYAILGNSTLINFGNGGDYVRTYLGAPALHEKGTWARTWAWVKGSTDGDTNDGEVKYWTLTDSGVTQRLNKTAVPTLVTGGHFENVSFPGYCRIPTANSMPTYDDVYVAKGPNAQARVEVGNASTYETSTNLTILTPTSWSSTSIQAVVNEGSFAEDASAYLFVINSSGVASAGKAITFAGAGTTPVVEINNSDPSNITTDSLAVTGTSNDDTSISGCKWRLSQAPDINNGTACTGTTSFSCATSGFSEGANTIYVGCYDPEDNYGIDSIVVNYAPNPPPLEFNGSFNLH